LKEERKTAEEKARREEQTRTREQHTQKQTTKKEHKQTEQTSENVSTRLKKKEELIDTFSYLKLLTSHLLVFAKGLFSKDLLGIGDRLAA
jgi:hypothetical protein